MWSWIGAFCFCGGILLMGSDGWMPWGNVLGAILFAMILPIARRQLEGKEG